MRKKSWITIALVIAVLVLSLTIILRGSNSSVEKETAKCIGSKAVLYVQLGCGACETQEKMFGNNLEYISKIDCFYERDLCIEKQIRGTPTWIINEEQYLGVKDIQELKELTGCLQ